MASSPAGESKFEGWSVAQLAKHVKDTYTIGPMWIKLDDLGIHVAQRRLNVPHCHSMIKDIIEKEGFSRVVYKSLLVVEPNPEKLHETYEYTASKYAAASGTPPVGAPRPLYAVVDGQHLSTGLKCLAAGNVQFFNDGNKCLTLPPKCEANSELYEHIKNGFYCTVLSHKSWVECPEGVRALCRLWKITIPCALSVTRFAMCSRL
jgi:hypothetical protein